MFVIIPFAINGLNIMTTKTTSVSAVVTVKFSSVEPTVAKINNDLAKQNNSPTRLSKA